MLKKVISTAIIGFSFFATSAFAQEISFKSIKNSISQSASALSNSMDETYAKSGLRNGVNAVHSVTTKTSNTFSNEINREYSGSSLQKSVKAADKAIEKSYTESGLKNFTQETKKFTQSLFQLSIFIN